MYMNTKIVALGLAPCFSQSQSRIPTWPHSAQTCTGAISFYRKKHYPISTMRNNSYVSGSINWADTVFLNQQFHNILMVTTDSTVHRCGPFLCV